jgi:hypothetical protein
MATPKRSKKPRVETLMRVITISGVNAGVSLSPSGKRGEDPTFHSSARLELVGTLDEPIRDVRDVEITLYSTPQDRVAVGKDPMPWIGLIHGFRPVLRPTVFVPEPAFDRMWVLALGGMAKYGHMSLTKPHYHDSYVINLSLSTLPDE